MRLLMITRKVDKDDGLAGFTYNWVKKLAANLDNLYVICLEKGNTDGLPDNVSVYSLGKENGKNRLREFFVFHKLSIKLVPKVDGVFAHQNPEYGLLISFWTKLFRKRLIAWYVHKQVSTKLKILNFLADKMVSVSKESFRLPSKKVVFLHHGIDTDIFCFKEKEQHEELRLLTISRISSTKQIDKMVDVVYEFKNKYNKSVIFKIVGEPTLGKDRFYLNEIKEKIIKLKLEDNIIFLGSVANDKTPDLYHWSDIFFNFSATGSVDKTVLEAMSCGTLVFVSNEAFSDILKIINSLMYVEDFSRADQQLAELLLSTTKDLYHNLRKYVEDNHQLDDLMVQIVNLFKK